MCPAVGFAKDKADLRLCSDRLARGRQVLEETLDAMPPSPPPERRRRDAAAEGDSVEEEHNRNRGRPRRRVANEADVACECLTLKSFSSLRSRQFNSNSFAADGTYRYRPLTEEEGEGHMRRLSPAEIPTALIPSDAPAAFRLAHYRHKLRSVLGALVGLHLTRRALCEDGLRPKHRRLYGERGRERLGEVEGVMRELWLREAGLRATANRLEAEAEAEREMGREEQGEETAIKR